MQKLLIATAMGALILTGCAKDTAPAKPTAPVKAEHHKEHKPHRHHHGHHSARPHFYVCDKDTKLIAHHDTENELIKLQVTAPTLNLKDQTIELKHVPSASGERYLNDANPASTYEWHAKGQEGMFMVNVGGNNYSYSCAIKPTKKR